MAKSKKKKNESEVDKLFASMRKSKPASKKPKTPGLIRYEELLKRMEALNLPPMDIAAEERRIRAAEGF